MATWYAVWKSAVVNVHSVRCQNWHLPLTVIYSTHTVSPQSVRMLSSDRRCHFCAENGLLFYLCSHVAATLPKLMRSHTYTHTTPHMTVQTHTNIHTIHTHRYHAPILDRFSNCVVMPYSTLMQAELSSLISSLPSSQVL